MKNIATRLIRDEKGQTLILALILLIIGGLMIAPLLSYMNTGLLAGGVYERKADELYAADAGVEDAIWKIQNSVPDFYPYEYPEPLSVNNRSVEVVIYRYDWDPTCGENLTYQILSTATSEDGTNTTIEAYLSVSYLDLSALLDNAIVSYDTITIQPGNNITGDVWLPDEDDLTIQPPGTEIGEVIDGEVKDEDDMSITWPTAEQLSTYYMEDVKHLEPYPDGYVINIPPGTTQDAPYVIGPLLAAGDLTINGDGWIKLDGTIYVKGTLFTNPTPEIHIALEGHTVFAEGDIKLNPGVWLHGSGCIIAVGDIDFQPSIASGEDDFILVMSITGTVFFHPSGDFTGCIAGDMEVQLQPGCTINWISPEGKGLDFPMGVGDDDELPPVTGLSILSWQINPQ